MDHDAEHLFLGSGLAGPDLELARALLDEHLDAGDDGDALLAGHAEERGLERVVDEIEDQLGVQVLRVKQRRGLVAGHADGRGVDDDVEGGLGDGVLLDGLGSGLAGELLRGFGGAVEDEDLGTLVAEAEDCGAGRAAGAEDEHLGSAERRCAFRAGR